MDRHFKLLAVFHVLFGLSVIGISILITFLLGLARITDSVSMPYCRAFLFGPDLVLRSIPIWVLTSVMPIFVGLPAIIGGIGIYFRKNWARMVLIFVGAVALIDFPLGTALGIYTLWVLLQPETKLQVTP